MRIVVLGWGSLIWNPGELRTKGEWHKDGPHLPVEFARISSGGSLTLVLLPGAKRVQVLWARMEHNDLNEAIENLRRRERTPTDENIGYLVLNSEELRSSVISSVVNDVRQWASEKNIDTVIWTDLKPKFDQKRNEPFNEENVIEYLRNLDPSAKKEAEEYIRKAPSQIKTNMRAIIERQLGWACLDNG